jgi:hypothetical protein
MRNLVVAGGLLTALCGCASLLGVTELPGVEGEGGTDGGTSPTDAPGAGDASDADAGFGTVIATDTNIGPLTIDSTNVYWANGQNIMKAPIGGGPSTLLAYDPSGPISSPLVHDANYVYWGDRAALIMKVAIAGGNPVQVSQSTMGSGWQPSGIAVDTSNVYWADNGGYIYDAPLTGGNAMLIAMCTHGSVVAFAVSGGTAYFTGGCGLSEVSLSGGSITTLAGSSPQLSPAGALAVGGGTVYWTTASGIASIPTAAGGTPVVLASNQGPFLQHGTSMALDAQSVYWTTETGPQTFGVNKVGLLGGTPTAVVPGGAAFFGTQIAIDGMYLYWSAIENAPDGSTIATIRRTSK